jgi:sporulation protein YlmC with PRC-barrel domain
MTDAATHSETAIDETNRLIASNKVEGTAVYNEDGEKLGSIHTFMVDRHSGQADYAVLSFGGLFGLGADHYPIPWEALTYDTEQGGYVVDIDKELLENAPRFGADDEPVFDDAYGEQVHAHYGLAYPYA